MWSNKLLLVCLQVLLDSEGGFRTGCRNVSRQQQSFSGLQSPRWSFSIKVCYSWVQIIFLLKHSCTYSCVKRGLKVCAIPILARSTEPNPKLMADLFSLNGPVKRQKLFVGVYKLDALSLVTSLWYLSTTLSAFLNETHLQLFACYWLFFEQILASVFDFFNLQNGLSVMKCTIIDH